MIFANILYFFLQKTQFSEYFPQKRKKARVSKQNIETYLHALMINTIHKKMKKTAKINFSRIKIWKYAENFVTL